VLIEQGPRLVFSGDVIFHTFFFSLTPSSMEHVQMCAGRDLMEKTLMESNKRLAKRQRCEVIGKQDLRESRNTIQV
jgi:hypothetical protein